MSRFGYVRSPLHMDSSPGAQADRYAALLIASRACTFVRLSRVDICHSGTGKQSARKSQCVRQHTGAATQQSKEACRVTSM